MRTFIAVDLSREIKDLVTQSQSHLKYAGADVKWVDAENSHLTLKFLGEITGEMVEQVKKALDSISRETSPFNFRTISIGAFPNGDYPRVVWLGIDKGKEELMVLSGKIDDYMSKLGFDKEPRDFAAHITLGRVRSGKNRAALKEKIASVDQAATVSAPQSVDCIMLYQSTLTPKGSIYTLLHRSLFT